MQNGTDMVTADDVKSKLTAPEKILKKSISLLGIVLSLIETVSNLFRKKTLSVSD